MGCKTSRNRFTKNIIDSLLPLILPMIADYAPRIGYDGELLDNAAYLKQLQNRPFVLKTNHTVKFQSQNSSQGMITKKCLIIDLEKASDAGLDLVGFDTIEKKYCDDQTK